MIRFLVILYFTFSLALIVRQIEFVVRAVEDTMRFGEEAAEMRRLPRIGLVFHLHITLDTSNIHCESNLPDVSRHSLEITSRQLLACTEERIAHHRGTYQHVFSIR